MRRLIEGTDYVIEDKTLKIKEGIKFIPKSSFEGNTTFEKIVFSSTLIHIGEDAFKDCDLTTEVNIPDSVRYISAKAFRRCEIKKLILGKNVIFIGHNAFAENNINSVICNSTKLKIIDSNAFCDNDELSGIDFNYCKGDIYLDDYIFGCEASNDGLDNNMNSTSNIFNFYGEYEKDDSVFTGKICSSRNTENYTYENGVLKIKNGVEVLGDFNEFTDCKRIEMPDSVVMILANSFNELSDLEDVSFSRNLLIIEANAFSGCSLKKNGTILPNSLCSINFTSLSNNKGTNKIFLPDTISFDNTFISDRFYYRYYHNEFEDIIRGDEINIAKLLEEEKAKLDALGLLPSTIKENSKLCNNISYGQSLLLKKFLVDFIKCKEYDEDNNIQFITDLLNLNEINISDMHEIINYLFEKKQIKTIYLLISYGYDFKNNSMISRAIINEMYDMIDILLLLGVDINEIGTIETTPLSTACIIGNYNVVRQLIEKGAALNKVDKNNKTAIDYALENKHKDIALLINSYNNEKSEIECDLETLNMQLRLGE